MLRASRLSSLISAMQTFDSSPSLPPPLEPPPSPPDLPQRSGRGGVALAALVASLAGLGLGYVAFSPQPPPQAAETIEVKPSPNVLLSVRELARLEAIDFHMERIIDLTDKQQVLFGLVEAQDSLLLVAVGDVSAGVDLAQLQPEDIRADMSARSVQIRLPQPRVFSTRIDNQRTYVHHRRTDALARRRESLEARARQEAESTLRQAAVEAGILDRAKLSTTRTIDSVLRSLGFEDIQIEWKTFSDPQGEVIHSPTSPSPAPQPRSKEISRL